MRVDRRPPKVKKLWVLRSNCGSVLEYVENRIEYTKKLDRPTPSDAKWEQMNVEEFSGCYVIKEPF